MGLSISWATRYTQIMEGTFQETPAISFDYKANIFFGRIFQESVSCTPENLVASEYVNCIELAQIWVRWQTLVLAVLNLWLDMVSDVMW